MTETTSPPPSPAAAAYIAKLRDVLGDRDPLATMHELPDAVGREVEGMTREQLLMPEAPGKWSVLQVVEHLVDNETIAAFRFRMIVAHDRPEIPAYDEQLWTARLHYTEADVAESLEELRVLRGRILRLLHRLSPAERARAGVHRERGLESVDRFIWLTAGHDLVHRRQIQRIKRAIGA